MEMPAVGEEQAAAPLADDERSRRPATVRCCAPQWRAFWTIVILNAIGTVITSLTVPDLSLAYYNGGVDPCKADSKSAACSAAQKKATRDLAIFGAVSAAISFFTSPLLGASADMVGRKPLIVLSELMAIVVCVALLCVGVAHLSIYFLYAAREVAALTPAMVAWNLFVTDLTPPDELAKVFAWIGAATSIDGVVAPLLTAVLTPAARLVVLAVVNVSSLLVATLVLRESRAAAAIGEVPSFWALQAQGSAGLKAVMKHRTRRKLLLLAFIGFLSTLGGNAVFLFYLKESFGMDATSSAPLTSIVTFSDFLVQVFAVKPLTQRLGLKGVILLSYSVGALVQLGFLLAPNRASIYAVGLFVGFDTVSTPAVLAAVTRSITAGAGELGVSLGTLQSVTMLGRLVGPLVYRSLYSFCLPFAGAPWILGMVLQVLSMGILLPMPSSEFSDADAAEEASGSPRAEGAASH